MIRLPLLYRSTRVPSGRTAAALNLTPRALGWRDIHFAVRQLASGAIGSGRTGREERCLVLLRGRFDVRWGGTPHRVGPRADVFSGYPHAVDAGRHALPHGRRTGLRDRGLPRVGVCHLVVTRAAARTADHRAGRLRPRDQGRRKRHAADRGHRASGLPRRSAAGVRGVHAGRQLVQLSAAQARYDDPPREVDLDEIYYYRFRDAGGYGLQRLYNSRRDDTLRVVDGDAVAVRDGYHAFVTAHRYDAYYLNAGKRRSMAASDDPEHAKFRHEWPPPDPRLSMVSRAEGAKQSWM